MTFKEDDIVMVCSFAGNRDGVDGDPEAFDITADRGDAKPLTFGAGIHYCLGANLARAELQEALAFLPARMPGPEARRRARARLDSRHLRAGAPADRMDVGLAHFLTDYGMDPVELARQVEERGFESLFLPEHTHIPVSRDTPYPGGGELPREYSHTHDPFVALAAMAAVTERLKLGTGVCLIIERDPIVTAKEVATRRPALRRPLPVRRRRRLEPRGDGEPRHRLPHPLHAHARERRGDEGDLDRGRGRVPRRRSSTSTRSGAGRSRSRSRIRRCWSAGSARRCWTGWSPTATSGSRTGSRARRTWRPGSPSSSAAPRRPGAGRSRSRSSARSPRRGCSSGCRDAGVTRSLFYLPPAEPGEVEQALDQLAGSGG